MTTTAAATTTSGGTTYELRVAGHIDDHWSAMLGDLAVTRCPDGTTVLTGPVTDQAQLHGVLARVRDLGVTLLSLRALDAQVPTADGRLRSRRSRTPSAPNVSPSAPRPSTTSTPPGRTGAWRPSVSG
jgi:hypothetical protein